MSKVAVIVGSLRKEAFSRKVANALCELAPSSLTLEIAEIAQLPLYNPDVDEQPPRAWQEFRELIRGTDAVLFVTPEYNRSIPGALKNALDVASRPYGQSAWDGKPAAIVSVSPGALGAFGANHHLRQSLVFVNMPTLQQPEVYLGGIADSLDENGSFTNESTQKFLSEFMRTFARWIEAVSSMNVAVGAAAG